jgi:hypothetical protein
MTSSSSGTSPTAQKAGGGGSLQRGIDPAQTEAPQRPNIYALYEQNIGPLTALLSEDLQEAEQTYAQDGSKRPSARPCV